MASEWALNQRKIQPKVNRPASKAKPNEWRRLSTNMAKELRISRRRLVKAVKRGRISFATLNKDN